MIYFVIPGKWECSSVAIDRLHMVPISVLHMNADHLGLVQHYIMNNSCFFAKLAWVDSGWFKDKSAFGLLLQRTSLNYDILILARYTCAIQKQNTFICGDVS
jgi:hypothetical protein